VDPSRVNTPAELAACLDGLRRRRGGLSYEAMEKAAAKLRSQAARSRWEPLGKSTVGEIVTGKRLPTKDKLRTFLAVCGVAPADLPQWLAAWERASTADQARPADAVRVREVRPRQLGVHAAIQVEGVPGELPIYVPRDIDDSLRAELTANAERGCFVLLIGGSSVGKTRTLYEAVLDALPDWWLVHPGDADAIRRLADAPTPRTVVWLDELHRYLGTGGGLTAGTVRGLLRAGAVLVATMWPGEYSIRIVPRQPGHDDPHARDRELLDLAKGFDVAGAFTCAEHDHAQELAAVDGRLRAALDSPDGGLTQVLAAGPQLVRWWEQAPNPYAKAIITAAVDAQRFGVESPVTTQFLADAAHGYLTPAQRATAPADWLEQALAYATTPLHGAAPTLSPVDGGTMGRTGGYVAADYLLQRSRRTRRAVRLPASLWQALVEHTDHPDDIDRLAGAAGRRMRYRYAEPLYRRLADSGYQRAGESLVELLVRQGRVAEVRERADAGDPAAVEWWFSQLADDGRLDDAIQLAQRRAATISKNSAQRLAELLLHVGRVDSAISVLQTRADSQSRRRLADLLLGQNRVEDAMDALSMSADAGDWFAAERLACLMLEHGRIDELRARADSGDWYAGRELADLLIQQDRIGELQARADAGEPAAALVLGRHLLEHGRAEEAITALRPVAEAGDGDAEALLINTLTQQGRTEEVIRFMRAEVARGISAAGRRLADYLVKHGRVDEAIQALRADRTTDATREIPELLIANQRMDEVREEANAGNRFARKKVIDVLVDGGQLNEACEALSEWAETGDHEAASDLAALLVKSGRPQDAIDIARAAANYDQLARLLVKEGQVEEAVEILRARADVSFLWAEELVELLAEQGWTSGLQSEVDAGTEGAAALLVDLLIREAKISPDEADRMRKYGLDADGSIHNPTHYQ
jgi:tetratricopeptide (TPR) repeat protein